MARATLMLEKELSDVTDRLEDLAGGDACFEADIELRGEEGARLLASIDPEAAEALTEIFRDVYERLAKKAEALKAAVKPGETLVEQMALLERAYKLYKLADDYYPLRLRIYVFKVGSSLVKVVGLDPWGDDPDLTFVAIEGPEDEVAFIRSELLKLREEEE